MEPNKNDHGEPPEFAKWLMWLFRKDTWAKQPLIATVASIIAVSVACSAIFGLYRMITDPGDNQVTSTDSTDAASDDPLATVVGQDKIGFITTFPPFSMPLDELKENSRSENNYLELDYPISVSSLVARPLTISKVTMNLLYLEEEPKEQFIPVRALRIDDGFFDETTLELVDGQALPSELAFVRAAENEATPPARIQLPKALPPKGSIEIRCRRKEFLDLEQIVEAFEHTRWRLLIQVHLVDRGSETVLAIGVDANTDDPRRAQGRIYPRPEGVLSHTIWPADVWTDSRPDE